MSKELENRSADRIGGGVRRAAQQFAFSSLYWLGGLVYDPFTHLLFGDAWSRWRRSVIPFVEEGLVLDLGCGTGALVDELVTLGVQAYGIDRERSMLRGMSKNSTARGRVALADSRRLPFRTSTFSTVTATFPAPFVLEIATLDEVARVLRPDGAFIVLMTGQSDEPAGWRWPIRLMLRIFYGDAAERTTPAPDVLAHPNLVGKWRWVHHEPDHVLLWVATSVSDPEAEGSLTP